MEPVLRENNRSAGSSSGSCRRRPDGNASGCNTLHLVRRISVALIAVSLLSFVWRTDRFYKDFGSYWKLDIDFEAINAPVDVDALDDVDVVTKISNVSDDGTSNVPGVSSTATANTTTTNNNENASRSKVEASAIVPPVKGNTESEDTPEPLPDNYDMNATTAPGTNSTTTNTTKTKPIRLFQVMNIYAIHKDDHNDPPETTEKTIHQSFDQWSTLRSIERARLPENAPPLHELEVTVVCAVFPSDWEILSAEELRINSNGTGNGDGESPAKACDRFVRLERSTITEYGNVGGSNSSRSRSERSIDIEYEYELESGKNNNINNNNSTPTTQRRRSLTTTTLSRRRRLKRTGRRSKNAKAEARTVAKSNSTTKKFNLNSTHFNDTTTHSSLLSNFFSKRELPFIQDLLDAAVSVAKGGDDNDNDNDDFYVMLTNSDIGVTKNFYRFLLPKLQRRQKAFTINRWVVPMDDEEDADTDTDTDTDNSSRSRPGITIRTPTTNHTKIDQLFDEIEATIPTGGTHQGVDCFLMHSSILPFVFLGDLFSGWPPWGRFLKDVLKNRIGNGNGIDIDDYSYKTVSSSQKGTFHLGGRGSWVNPVDDPEGIGRAATSYVKEVRGVDMADCRLYGGTWVSATIPFAAMNQANCGKVFREHYPMVAESSAAAAAKRKPN